MDTTDYTYNAPYLQNEVNAEQVTIDESYYSELVKISRLTKKYFKLLENPLEKTSDELQEINKIKNQIKKLL